MTDTDKKPYGLHRIYVTPYTDGNGTILSDTSYRLPIARTLTFAESEDTETLDGDDKKSVAIQGKGATVDGQLEGGGVSLMVWSIITGGQMITTGLGDQTAGEVIKKGSDRRPYFRIDAQVIANDGGDFICRIFRCMATGKVSSDFKYGAFAVTNADITGTPMPGDDDDYLYLLRANKTKSTLSATPEPNPLPIPSNVEVGTITASQADLTWDTVAGADSYKVEQSTDSGATWSPVSSVNGGEPTANSTTVKGLSASTAYQLHVAAVFSEVTGTYSSPVTVTTLAS